MKTSIIPAQITTVEDKIAGNFTLTQILLLLTPLFVTVIIYAALPVRLHFSFYKIPTICIVSILCFFLAVRIKGKLILHWLMLLSEYYSRPRYYIFNKNVSVFRTEVFPLTKENASSHFVMPNGEKLEPHTPDLSLENSVKFDSFVSDPRSTVRFRFKKGGLNVITSQLS